LYAVSQWGIIDPAFYIETGRAERFPEFIMNLIFFLEVDE
jgi:hypothetical protein